MTVHGHPEAEQLLEAYFGDLDAALSDLPRARREQLMGEIRQHVDQALAELQPGSTSDVRDVLDRVGQPEEIAAAALDEGVGAQPRRMGTGVRFLIAGAALLAVAGLATGLVLGLSSPTSPSAGRTTTTLSRSHQATTTLPTSPPQSSSTTTTTTTSSPPPSTTSPLRAVLSPATVPPVGDECTLQLTYDADGNVGPLLCPDGGVNAQAWQHYAQGSVNGQPSTWSKVLQLGPYASPAQVYQAMCTDYQDVYGTNPLTVSAGQLAAAYYGWQFAGDNPVLDFQQLGCPPPS